MAKNKRIITDAKLEDDVFIITFSDGSKLHIYDGCNDIDSDTSDYRFITTDDNPKEIIGGHLLDVECKPVNIVESGDTYETMFVDVKTTNGVVTLCTHNRHNGYYGGFDLRTVRIPAENPAI